MFVMQFKGRQTGVEWTSQQDNEQPVTVNVALAGCKLTLRINDATTVVAVPPEAVDALFDMFAASVTDASEYRQQRATTRTEPTVDFQEWYRRRSVNVGKLEFSAVDEELRLTKQAIEAHATLLASSSVSPETADALRLTLERLQQNLPGIEAAYAQLSGQGVACH